MRQLHSQRIGLIVLGGLIASGCTQSKPITELFVDNFNRNEIGADYHNTGGPYTISGGELRVHGAYNKPLWLRRRLPRNAVIDLDVRSATPDGDIKIELWGDGRSYAEHRGAYLATSYVLIFGGWSNSISAIARLDEHGADRKERRDIAVKPGQHYHWTITRNGKELDWAIDGKPFLHFTDSAPLEGASHAYLGFNNWASDIAIDNLRIKPLP